MGRSLKKLVVALPATIVVAALIPATMVMTGCKDPVSPKTVVQYDTLSVHDTTTPPSDTVTTRNVTFGRVINLDNEKGSVGNLVTDHYLSGALKLANNFFYGMGGEADSAKYLMKYSDVDTSWHKDSITARIAASNYFNVDAGVTRDKWVPAAGSPAFTSARTALPAGDTFFTKADYIGAFGSTDWMSWTFHAQVASDAITDDTTTKPIVDVTDASINAGETVAWSADTTYVLNGFVFIEDGATLTIPAGTVIKAKAGGQLNASALIVARGGKINVNGTASHPVIMTAEQDDLHYLDDVNGSARGLWGGLILLGKSITQRLAGVEQIEGITQTDSRGQYGGTDPADNSGTVTYLSIRYGGTNIGEGNEINGLTFGAVGSGTTINNVESFNNADDGFEFFGGTAQTKYMLASGCGDDSFDWDEGFRGKGQFWTVIQSSDAGDRGIEADGCASDNRGDATGYSQPTIYNATFIGTGADDGKPGNMVFKLREETGAFIYNSIFTDFYGDRKVVQVTE